MKVDRRNPSRRLPGTADPWVPPEETYGFETRIGESVLEEFVLGHHPADVLRELVQNEFDGGGSRLEVIFGEQGLTVSGNGRHIRADGWKRLTVIMGTGRSVGAGGTSGESVEAKANGIGSKNFGLRSVFLFGDRIHVRSGGKMAVLDLPQMGTVQKPDPSSVGEPGVSLYVPYRTEARGKLEDFTVEREQRALDRIATELLPTLVKLALGGQRQGLREFSLRSVRTGRSILWTQTIEPERCKLAGVIALRRKGRLVEVDPRQADPPPLRTFEEIEFSRAVALPSGETEENFPTYYKAQNARARVAVSVPIRRKRIDLSAQGKFYYPLQTPSSATGTPISISAPFRLNNDRSQIAPADWNDAFATAAGELVKDLLTADWWQRFGADAFLALRTTGQAAPATFSTKVMECLSEAPCWPTAAGGWSKAEEIVLPTSEALRGFLSAERYLAGPLTERSDAEELARASGAKPFDLNSLVRLRCADEGGKGLVTKLSPDLAHFYYPNYVTRLSSPDLQKRMAAALSQLSKHLSNANRTDLRKTSSTLAADGTLKPAEVLIRVDPAMWQVCPEPLASRLHPVLLDQPLFVRLCDPFDLEDWVKKACERARNNTIDPDEREVLFARLLADPETFSLTALAAVRRSPVVRNHRGVWTAPEDLVLLPRAQAATINKVLSAPASALAASNTLVRRLRIRSRLKGSDLVTFAQAVADRPELAEPFEALLKKEMTLLTGGLVRDLKAIPFLRARGGRIAAPQDLHLDNSVNRACLGSDALIVAGSSQALFQRLKCRERPSLEALRSVLDYASEALRPPPHPEAFYPALASAVEEEEESGRSLEDEPVVWVADGYYTPRETLVGKRVPSLFHGIIPVFSTSEVVERSLETLGATSLPQGHHWIAFFEAIADRRGAQKLVSVPDRRRLHEAYRRLRSGLPPNLSLNTPCLLGRNGELASHSDLRTNLFLEDDEPELAKALEAAGGRVIFADLPDGSREFYAALHLKRLSDLRPQAKITAGPPRTAPSWFNTAYQARKLSFLRSDVFAIAVRELAWAQQRRSGGFVATRLSSLRRWLAALTAIGIVEYVKRTYRFGGVTVSVKAESAAIDDRLLIAAPRSNFELDQMLAQALAERAGATLPADSRPLAAAIFGLFACRGGDDLGAYLLRQGISYQATAEELDYTADDEDKIASQDAAETIVRQIVGGITIEATGANATKENNGGGAPKTSPPPLPPPPLTLPPLSDVHADVAQVVGAQVPASGSSGGGGNWGGGGWNPPTSQDQDRDRKVGERGEEIAYQLALDQVRKMGHADPTVAVIWTSKANPGADHDIRSIGADGKPVWIEVKATTGTDGRFHWPKNEFQKALREGDRYELWRVYEAHTEHPTIKIFRNPAAMIQDARLHLELGLLRATLEPKSAG